MTVVLLLPDDVAVVDEPTITAADVRPGAVYVGRLPDGPLYCLDGSAAVVWHEARGQEESGVVARVARRTGLGADLVADDVRRCIAELISLGLLMAVEQGG